MNIKIEIVNENKAIVTAEIDKETVENAILNEAANIYKRENEGKEPSVSDPVKIYDERKDEVSHAVVHALAHDVQYNAASMNRLQPISHPTAEVKGELEFGKAITLVVTFDIVPKLHLGKYIGVEATKQKTDVTSDEVNALVNSELNSKKQIIAKSTPSVLGDTVVIDFEGFCGGVAFEGGKAEKYSLKLGSGMFIPGFEEQLVGKTAGEDTEVFVKFPDAYTPELAGKDAVFKIKLHAVQEEKIPVLDDTTVKEISGGACATVSDYLELKRSELQKKKEDEAENALSGELFEKICADSYASIPDSMVEGALENEMKSLESAAKNYGIDVDTLLMYSGMPSLDAYKENVRANIKREIIFSLVLQEIAIKESLMPTPKDIEDAYTAEAEKMSGEGTVEEKVKELKSKTPPQAVVSYLMSQRVLDFVRSKAIIK